jgi:uncharacterized protein (DUF1778 family)
MSQKKSEKDPSQIDNDAEVGADERRTIDVLLNKRLFELDADKFDAFASALDDPPPSGPALKALMKRRPLWQN